jgi:hypothetical protein
VRFANVDDQLLLWIDGELALSAAYEPDELFAGTGGRRGMLPWADVVEGGDQGDLSPAGIGARGAKLAISRMAVLRDVYYIAANEDMPLAEMQQDYDMPFADRTIDGEQAPRLGDLRDLFTMPDAWVWFRTRRSKEFPVKTGSCSSWATTAPRAPTAACGRAATAAACRAAGTSIAGCSSAMRSVFSGRTPGAASRACRSCRGSRILAI